LYTAVEYAPGIALTDLITLAQERGQYPSEAFTLYLGAELASALHHAHTRVDEQGTPLGIVHRNLTPETIRVTWEGTVKLGDFGLAHSLLPGRQATTLRAPRLPAFYTAPEMLLGAPVDVQAELFVLGLVLLEVCTGRNPFDWPDKTPRELEESLPGKVQRLVRRRVRTLLAAGLDGGVETAVWGAAALNSALEAALREQLAGLRPYDAEAVLAEVEQIMSDAGASLVEQEVAGAAKEQLRSLEQIATR
jgi:serine/threonine protein kinase